LRCCDALAARDGLVISRQSSVVRKPKPLLMTDNSV
jgi:hypothetical protein